MALGASLPARNSLSTGAIRYVDPSNSTGTASDANNGQTRTAAWRTMPYAIANQPFGGRCIVIGNGVVVTPPAGDNLTPFRWNRVGGSSSLMTTFECETNKGVTLDTGIAANVGTFRYGPTIQQPGLRLQGFKISGRGYLPSSGEGGGQFYFLQYAKECEIYDCWMTNQGGQGCIISGNVGQGAFVDDIWWYRCLFDPCGLDARAGTSDHTDGYYGSRGTHSIYGPDNAGSDNAVAEGGRRMVVASCIFRGNVPGGTLQLGGAAMNGFVVNTVFYGNTGLGVNGAPTSNQAGNSIQFFSTDAGTPYRSNNNKVINCISAFNKGSIAYGAGSDLAGNLVDYCLAYGNQNVASSGDGWPNSEDYPVRYGYSSSAILYTKGTHNLASADPKFVDAPSGDFRLQVGSPCLGAADPNFTPPLDFAGNPFNPTTPSLGAFEGAQVSPPSTLEYAPMSSVWPGGTTLGAMPASTTYGTAGYTLGAAPMTAVWPPPGAGSSASVRSTGATGIVNGTTLTLSKPTGVANSDVLIAIVQARSINITAPSGWTDITPGTEINPHNLSGALWSRCHIYSKVITSAGGEPASYDWTLDLTDKHQGVILCIQGADNASPIVASAKVENASSLQTLSAPSLTLLGTGACLLCVVFQGASTTFASPSGMTERVDFPSGASGSTVSSMAVATQDNISSGPTGSKTFTDQATSGWFEMAGASIAIKAA